MLANTGSVSLALYALMTLISFAGMVVLYRYIKQSESNLTEMKATKLTELFKTVIITTAFSSIALIITDLFKERDQDLEELAYFDKYVADVKKADGIYERWELAKYFSAVSPTGEMRESWREYYKILDAEYKEYLKLKDLKTKNDTIKKPSQNKQLEIIRTIERIEALESPLSTAGNTEWGIVVGTDVSAAAAQDEVKKAQLYSDNVRVDHTKGGYQTIIFGLHSDEDAATMLNSIRKNIRTSAYITKL